MSCEKNTECDARTFVVGKEMMTIVNFYKVKKKKRIN